MSRLHDRLGDDAVPTRGDDPLGPDVGGEAPDPVETPERTRARRTVFWWVLALFVGVGALALLTAPFAEVTGDGEIWTLALAPVVAAAMLAGLGWLTLHVVRRPRRDAARKRKEADLAARKRSGAG